MVQIIIDMILTFAENTPMPAAWYDAIIEVVKILMEA